ncbi:MAG: ArsI/CadI family heavy metal resistance metalloenzyme [Acidimicrobiia bacterium]
MSRLQLALNVSDLEQSVKFYAQLFGAEPVKLRPGYANFAIADPPLKLVLFENPGAAGSINHLGVEHAERAAVQTAIGELTAAGMLPVIENETECCYAVQDKAWVTAPDGEAWEVYTVLSDVPEDAPSTTCCTPA